MTDCACCNAGSDLHWLVPKALRHERILHLFCGLFWYRSFDEIDGKPAGSRSVSRKNKSASAERTQLFRPESSGVCELC